MLRTIASKHGRGEDEAFAAWERGGQLRTRCHDTAMTRIESTHTPILPVEKKVNEAARWVWIFCGHCSCQLVFPEAAAGLGRWQQQQHLIDLLFPSSQSVIRPRPPGSRQIQSASFHFVQATQVVVVVVGHGSETLDKHCKRVSVERSHKGNTKSNPAWTSCTIFPLPAASPAGNVP